MVFTALAERLDAAPDGAGDRLPKYLRVSHGIARAIEAGDLRSGERLPAEVELARQLPASLGTIQKALNHLAERGLVIRRHGHGTFVGAPAAALDDPWHFRFLADDGRTILPVFTEVLDIVTTEAPGPWRDFLAAGDLIVVTRRLDVNHDFAGLSRLYLPAARFADLLNTPAGRLANVNIRVLLSSRFGAITDRVLEQVACGPLPADVTRALGLSAGATGLIYHMAGFEGPGRELSYQIAYFPANGRRLATGEKHQ